jgi:tRNA(adenine34) deaminase
MTLFAGGEPPERPVRDAGGKGCPPEDCPSSLPLGGEVAGAHGGEPVHESARGSVLQRADVALMRLALAEATVAPASGDVPIGAIVVDATGEVIGRGHNMREALSDPTAHAEILALRAAAALLGTWNLSGCTLAVTVEPCTMCAGAAVAARLDAVVFGCWEPKTGAAGSLWDVLRDRRLTHRVEVRPGVLADRCAALLAEFFAARR